MHDKIRNKMIVVYVMLPLLLLSFSMGAVALFVSPASVPIDIASSRAFQTLAKPVSLMAPYSSGDYYQEMLSIKADFEEYNQDYGSRLTIYSATGSSASLGTMKTYISTTERMHLSSHGYWSSTEGPVVSMSGPDLNADAVQSWSLTGGLAKVLYLSACNTMGHNGILDDSLANKLREKTSIVGVVGFRDVANMVAATLLSQAFWGYHVTFTSSGGISSWASFTNSRDRVLIRCDLIRALGSISIGVAVGLLVGLAMSGVGSAFVSGLLSGITSLVVFYLLLDDIEATANDFEYIGDSVAGLYWPTGGGGGGGGKPYPMPY